MVFDTLKKLIGVESIEKFEDLLKVNEFCFSLIPWTTAPYKMGFREDLFSLCEKFKNKEIGGWCGLSATFFQRVLWAAYGFQKLECVPFDYGTKSFTHITLIVKWNNKEYVIDPYFCRVYTYEDGNPIEFNDLILMLFNRELDKIHETFGEGVKYVYEEYSKDFIEYSPQQLLKSVEDSWIQLYSYESFMSDVFNNTNSKLLMLLKKIKG